MPIPERDCPLGLTVWRKAFPYRCVRCGECLKRCSKNAVELSHFPLPGIEDIPAENETRPVMASQEFKPDLLKNPSSGFEP
ncbi:hypothetical protein [Dehalococcoides mccartyi]|uniref:hypothetical protein n=1 Tax=Dehalococcoides mccartyi TaxID=61435 RepID=UPI002AFDD7A7|nr:hypothetical protein [Dehalococcoides mccartyi]